MSYAPAVAQPVVLADVIPASRLRDVALVVGGALFTAACAQISIPVPGDPVPITGQTLAVMVCGAGLGAVRGSAAMALYWLLGLIGLPFYADGEGGVHAAFGATGGYLIGFMLAAYIVGRLAEAQLDRRPIKAFPLFALGQLVIFAIGVPWLAVNQDLSLGDAIALGFTPFILGGIVKAVLAAGLLSSAWRLVGSGFRPPGETR
jgi:biotin transport system substrate-specific component